MFNLLSSAVLFFCLCNNCSLDLTWVVLGMKYESQDNNRILFFILFLLHLKINSSYGIFLMECGSIEDSLNPKTVNTLNTYCSHILVIEPSLVTTTKRREALNENNLQQEYFLYIFCIQTTATM